MSEIGIPLGVCARCGAGYHPLRLVCARCGGHRFELHRVERGIVEEVTVVRRSMQAAARAAGAGPEPGPAVLATVRLAGGQRVIAGLEDDLRGPEVMLVQRGSAVLAYSGQRRDEV